MRTLKLVAVLCGVCAAIADTASARQPEAVPVSPTSGQAIGRLAQQTLALPAPTTAAQVEQQANAVQATVNAAVALGNSAGPSLWAEAKASPAVARALLRSPALTETDIAGSAPAAARPAARESAVLGPIADTTAAASFCNPAGYAVSGRYWTVFGQLVGRVEYYDEGWCFNGTNTITSNKWTTLNYAANPIYCLADQHADTNWEVGHAWQTAITYFQFGNGVDGACFASGCYEYAALRVAANGYWDKHNDWYALPPGPIC